MVSKSRREFLKISAATTGGAALAGTPAQPATRGDLKSPPAFVESANGDVEIALHINDVAHTVSVEPRVSLLDALRERLGMTGTKKGCDQGACGACTVHIDGRRALACLTLAMSVQGKKIRTIEGLGTPESLHPMQAAFLKHDGFQCGYCTSGQIMSGVALVKEGHIRDEAEIREWMSGNICRCGAYPNIVKAIEEAAPHMQVSSRT